MTKTMLLLFWVLWLLNLLAALLGYREFMNGLFGRYATPSLKYVGMWTVLLLAILLILSGSLYFKNREQSTMAMIVVVIPLVLALPYALFLAVVMMSGNNRWN